MFVIKEADINSKDAQDIIKELNIELLKLTGTTGQHSFYNASLLQDKSVFLIGYLDHQPIACGGLRPFDQTRCEFKRIFAKKNHIGAGHQIMSVLTNKAKEFGYQEIVLETRSANEYAINFYLSLGYHKCSSYGPYRYVKDAVCMTKKI